MSTSMDLVKSQIQSGPPWSQAHPDVRPTLMSGPSWCQARLLICYDSCISTRETCFVFSWCWINPCFVLWLNFATESLLRVKNNFFNRLLSWQITDHLKHLTDYGRRGYVAVFVALSANYSENKPSASALRDSEAIRKLYFCFTNEKYDTWL